MNAVPATSKLKDKQIAQKKGMNETLNNYYKGNRGSPPT